MTRRVTLGAALFGVWACGENGGSEPSAGENSALTDVVAISAGYLHSCAVRGDGSVVCWGDNISGALGNGAAITLGSANQSPVPVRVSGISDAVTVSAGQLYTCAVLASGKVQCWGANEVGQLGNGTRTSSSVPVDVAGIDDAVDVTTAGNHACALHSSGAISCWGQTIWGLGDGMTNESLVPVSVTGLGPAIAVTSGARTGGYTCAVTFDQNVYCWGTNARGQLGIAAPSDGTSYSPIPQQVLGVTGASRVDAGEDATCATTIGGALYCWGSGNLGSGVTSTSSLPLEVTELVSVGEVSVGSSQTCVRLQVGGVACWGYDGIESAELPEAIVGIDSALAVSAGGTHSCARMTTGIAQCWGSNEAGALGDGTEQASSVPVTVKSLR